MSSQLTQRDSLDTESELAPQEAPPWVIRWTAWLLIASVSLWLADRFCNAIAGERLVAASFAYPQRVLIRFKSPRQAIISRVVVEEGQPVKAGDELFVLRSDEIGGWDTLFRTATAEDLRSKQESLNRNGERFRCTSWN